ncbi:hypothetical protein TNCV_4948961 [Trichonephila clavipes]|nr:hypothetical protein TNCV_4948961 [Trichonephila clavipes]
MGSPLNARNETLVAAKGETPWVSAEESKADRICWRGHYQRVLRCERGPANVLACKKEAKTHQKTPGLKKKTIFHVWYLG